MAVGVLPGDGCAGFYEGIYRESDHGGGDDSAGWGDCVVGGEREEGRDDWESGGGRPVRESVFIGLSMERGDREGSDRERVARWTE